MSKPQKTKAATQTQVGGTHYKDMAIQPWEAFKVWLTPEEYRGYHKATVIGYIARERQKGGDQDIQKASHHLQELMESWGEQPPDDSPPPQRNQRGEDVFVCDDDGHWERWYFVDFESHAIRATKYLPSLWKTMVIGINTTVFAKYSFTDPFGRVA